VTERQTIERNQRNLIIEVFWAGIFTGCVSFNAAYMIRLGGSNLLVSLLSSGAALINAVATLPFAAMLERRARRKPWIVGSLAVVRFGHLGLIAIPWLSGFRPEAMALLLIVVNIPVALFVAGFLPMLADIIPIERRARVFAGRNTLIGATVMVSTVVLGWWLDHTPFPLNYQLLYALAVVSSTISTLYIARLTVPDSPVIAPAPRESLAALPVRQLAAQQRPFVNIVLNTLVFNLPFWMAAPLQPIYFVRVLGASDAWLGLWLGVLSGGTILGNQLWRRVIDRRGDSWALPRSTVLSAAYYLLIGTFPDLNLILLFTLVAGVVNPGIEISHLNTLLRICPADRRATYIGVFVTVMNIGFFLAPLAVAPLTDAIGAQALVIGIGALRLVGGLLFTLNPVRVPAPELAAAD